MSLINSHKDKILNITFIRSIEEEIAKKSLANPMPTLLNWTLDTFEWYYMDLTLNFNNSIYVSPNRKNKDKIHI